MNAETPATEVVHTGCVKWFNATKGYGFIVPDAGTEDVFVHFTAIVGQEGYKSLKDADRVSYNVVKGHNPKNKFQAANVRVTEPA